MSVRSSSINTSDLKRRISLMMTQKNIVNQVDVSADLKCNLCQAVLFEPVECDSCRNRYCHDCFHKFFEAVKSCPKGCSRPTFTPILEQIRKRLTNYQFFCTNREFGCQENVRYDQVIVHENSCQFKMLKCSAFKDCKTKCLRKDIDNHEKTCGFISLNCEYCNKKGILRRDIGAHFKECKACFNCERCKCQIDAKSERGKDHDCIVALSQKMDSYTSEKDAIISHLMYDLRKKDEVIRDLIQKFTFLERKLLKSDTISHSFKDEYMEFNDMEKERREYERDSSFSSHKSTPQQQKLQQVSSHLSSPEPKEREAVTSQTGGAPDTAQDEDDSDEIKQRDQQEDEVSESQSDDSFMSAKDRKYSSDAEKMMKPEQMYEQLKEEGGINFEDVQPDEDKSVPEVEVYQEVEEVHDAPQQEEVKTLQAEEVETIEDPQPETQESQPEDDNSDEIDRYGLEDGFWRKIKEVQDPLMVEKMKAAREPLYKFIDLMKSDDWKYQGKTKGYIEYWTRESDEGLFCCYAKATIDYSIEMVSEYIIDPDSMLEYNDMMDNQTIIEEYPHETFITHAKFKRIMVVSARDFVMHGGIARMPDKSLYLYTSSTTHPDWPEQKGAVRAELKCGGWYCKPVGENATELHYVSESDLKGNIPKWVVSKGASQMAQMPDKFKQMLVKKEKAKKK